MTITVIKTAINTGSVKTALTGKGISLPGV